MLCNLVFKIFSTNLNGFSKHILNAMQWPSNTTLLFVKISLFKLLPIYKAVEKIVAGARYIELCMNIVTRFAVLVVVCDFIQHD